MGKDAYYFSHDSNARNDPKILAMMNIYRCEGYGWFWIVIEMLSEQSDYKLKHCLWVYNALAIAMLCDAITAEKFVMACINDFELLRSDNQHFWSESLLRRMKMKEQKREIRSIAGRKGAASRWGNGNAMPMPIQTDDTAIAKDGKGKERKVKKRKVKDIYITVQHLSMNEDEYKKLVDAYGESTVNNKIEYARNYAKLKNYKSLYLTLNNWLKMDAERDKHGTHTENSKSGYDCSKLYYQPKPDDGDDNDTEDI
ncbi:MAG: Lin1244/Lin1753 domain-containing protein [Smithella sp.]